MPLHFIKSEKGKDVLVHDGFLYRFESKKDKKTIWKCVENLKKKCKARIHTEENSILSDVTKISHVHFPDIAKIEAKRAMANLKELAKKTELSTQSIVATVASELNTGQMPGIPLMKKTILRVRERENAAPGITAINIWSCYTRRIKKHQMVSHFYYLILSIMSRITAIDFYYFLRKKICR
uniref:FLYWCH-type zinc finger-containing protein 1 n=1 Tax=Schizaphis graminum TaxID=13262 RepID=A0A2S2NTJ8_SCHGA